MDLGDKLCLLFNRPLTLSPPVATYRFYSVQRQTILLVKGRPLVVKGLIWLVLTGRGEIKGISSGVWGGGW